MKNKSNVIRSNRKNDSLEDASNIVCIEYICIYPPICIYMCVHPVTIHEKGGYEP